MKVETLIKEINKHKTVIAERRDALRDLVQEAEEIESDCEEAVRALEDAVDCLSRQL